MWLVPMGVCTSAKVGSSNAHLHLRCLSMRGVSSNQSGRHAKQIPMQISSGLVCLKSTSLKYSVQTLQIRNLKHSTLHQRLGRHQSGLERRK